MASAEDYFWELADPWLDEPDVEAGTVMRLPCLRVGGEFAAAADGTMVEGMVVKLPAERISQMIASGAAEPFPSAERPFREWAAVADTDQWPDLIADAVAFARGELEESTEE